jgi:hypothetical protein
MVASIRRDGNENRLRAKLIDPNPLCVSRDHAQTFIA